MMHQLHLPHIASSWGVLSDWHYPFCAGKRAREAGNEGDDEAGPSKQPRTGVSVCYFCYAPQSSLLRAGACTLIRAAGRPAFQQQPPATFFKSSGYCWASFCTGYTVLLLGCADQTIRYYTCQGTAWLCMQKRYFMSQWMISQPFGGSCQHWR